MHPAVGHQPKQMQPAAARDRFTDRFQQNRVFIERTVTNALIDADEILQDDAPASHDHVSDLGISHLPVRQAHGGTAGLQLGERMFGEQGVQPRSPRLCQGIVLGVGVDADPVQDDQDSGAATIHRLIIARRRTPAQAVKCRPQTLG